MNDNPIKIYTDDFEVIDILKKLPKVPVPPFNGLTLLEYIDKHIGVDFGIVFPANNIFHVVYKYGSYTDSGLILITCSFENSKYLKSYFDKVDRVRLFPNENLRKQIISDFYSFSDQYGLVL